MKLFAQIMKLTTRVER